MTWSDRLGSSIANACARRLVAALVVLVVPSLAPAPAAHAYPRPSSSVRVDVSNGEEAAQPTWSSSSSISADGRFVAFDHIAGNLTPGDVNQLSDVFVRDTRTGRTELISFGLHGVPAVGVPSPGAALGIPGVGFTTDSIHWLSFDPSISADGRFVAFTSFATNLVDGDTNGLADVFVFDRSKSKTKRVSVSTDGRQASAGAAAVAGSSLPSISANGRFVSFSSDAANLVANDGNGAPDVFVHDRTNGRTTRVSIDSDERESDPCLVPEAGQCNLLNLGRKFPSSSLNRTGRYVVFDSPAADLVGGDTNAEWDVFVRDRTKGRTERVSVATDGSEVRSPPHGDTCTAWGSSLTVMPGYPVSDAISADGRYVVFASNARGLVPVDTTGPPFSAVCFQGRQGTDVFVRDRHERRTERVSVESHGGQVEAHADHAAISADGRHVAFFAFSVGVLDTSEYRRSDGTTLAIYDRATGAVDISEIQKDTSRRDWHLWQEYVDLSATGRYVSYRNQYSALDDPLKPRAAAFFRLDRGGSVNAGGLSSPAFSGGPLGRGLRYAAVADDPADASPSPPGAELVGAAIAHRPERNDLYLKIAVDRLPGPRAPLGSSIGVGNPALVYGLRLMVDGQSFEVRAASAGVEPRVGLFRCDPVCFHQVDLRGGFGTVGESVVTSVPLDALGVSGGSGVGAVRATAYSAVGSFARGAIGIADEVQFSVR